MTIIIALLLYSAVGSYYALACVYKRYYKPDKQPPVDLRQLKSVPALATYGIPSFNFIDTTTNFVRHINPISVPAGDDITIKGWAVDILAGSPASAVLLYLDHSKIFQTDCGLESPEAAEKLHDAGYRFSGFSALIPSKGLARGAHCLSMKVVSKNGELLYNTDMEIKFPIK